MSIASWDSSKSKFAILYPGSATTALTDYIKSIDGLPGKRNLNDITTFGRIGHVWAAGLQEAEVTVEMVYNEDASGPNAIFTPLRTATVEVGCWYCPTGVTTSQVFYGWLMMNDFDVKAIIGSAVHATAKFQINNGTATSSPW